MKSPEVSASAIAYARIYSTDVVGFALPLLLIPGNAGYFIQEMDDNGDIVVGFKEFDLESEKVEKLPQTRSIKTGDSQFFVFLTKEKILSGNRSEIEHDLRVFAAKNSQNAAIILQIYQIIGSSQERRNARIDVRRLISRRLGPRGEEAFHLSAVRSAFWGNLVSKWKLKEDPVRLTEIKSTLILRMDRDKLNISGLHPRNETEERELYHIISELKIEFEAPLQPVNQPMARAERHLAYELIIKSRRQEERIAILLRTILLDRKLGISILRRYQPRAKFEAAAIELIIRQFDHPSRKARSEGSQLIDELTVAKLVSNFYTAIFPADRGHLLEALALHLRSFPHVRDAIRRKFMDSQSFHVHRRSEIIRRYL